MFLGLVVIERRLKWLKKEKPKMKKRILTESLNLGVSSVIDRVMQEHQPKSTILEQVQEWEREALILGRSHYVVSTTGKAGTVRLDFIKHHEVLKSDTERKKNFLKWSMGLSVTKPKTAFKLEGLA